jgi:hypothetical protein
VEVLVLAREMGMLHLGTVALDGTKIHANASRHRALSYQHAGKIETQLRAEVGELMAKAEAADRADFAGWLVDPRRIGPARGAPGQPGRSAQEDCGPRRGALCARAAGASGQAAAGEAEAKKSGKTPGDGPPDRPAAGPRPSDQIDLTDEASRIMPVADGGFEQCYNAQAVVAAGNLLVVANDVVQAANDKQQIGRCWTSSPPCPAPSANPRPCWPITAISAPRM